MSHDLLATGHLAEPAGDTVVLEPFVAARWLERAAWVADPDGNPVQIVTRDGGPRAADNVIG